MELEILYLYFLKLSHVNQIFEKTITTFLLFYYLVFWGLSLKTLCHVSVLLENGVQGIILLNIERKYVIWVFDYRKFLLIKF